MPLKTLITLLRVVEDQGYPEEQALAVIELDYNPLLSDKPMPERIPSACYSNLYRLLIKILQDGALGLGTVAESLHISARTMHRRLTSEGTSFQQLKDSFRQTLAVHYIARPELSIDAIAALIGFQDNAAFYRSFKKWTGVSPGQYRQQLRTPVKSNA